ncbi:MAG: DUF4335 domain-containing protein [Cyanobacteriota bacterium ELA615]|jgi:hypothetical protein
MNIRREYSSPNCTLILEGFGDNMLAPNASQSLSVLVNAQCHLLGIPNKLDGGRVFLENLSQTLNSYAQQILSGIVHPQSDSTKGETITIEKVANMHRLSYYPLAESQQQSTTIDLSTVQLFDLVETVDQFLADTRTLPELSPQLQPLGHRYRRVEESPVKKALPAVVGTASLALTGFLVYLIPTPNLPKIEGKNPKPSLIVPKSPQSKKFTNSPKRL